MPPNKRVPAPQAPGLTDHKTGQGKGSRTKSTLTPRRLTMDGQPGITRDYHDRRDAVAGRSYSSLAAQLVDADVAAERLLEELGPAQCTRLGLSLIAVAREVRR